MNKFDMQSAKFVGIIIGICVIFLLVVWHAFSYLPQKEDNIAANQEINLPAEEEQREDTQVNEETQNDDNEETDDVKIDSPIEVPVSLKNTNKPKLEPLEPISEDIGNGNSLSGSEISNNENSLDTALNNAKNYSREHNYASSISEYQKAISLTNDNSIKAQCYENIAKIYATSKRYGSALSAAQKAFNTEPSTSREILLARLYYKTGDIDKATDRINNVLKRDFNID